MGDTLTVFPNSQSPSTNDWAVLCERANIHTNVSGVLKAGRGELTLWASLLNLACQRLQEKKPERVQFELARLKAVLDGRLDLRATSRLHWEGDYRLFTQFMLCWAGGSITPIEVNSLWTLGDSAEAEARYDNLITTLLAERGAMLMQAWKERQAPRKKSKYGRLKNEVSHWEKKLKSLSKLDRGTSAEVANSSQGTLRAFLEGVLIWIGHLLSLFQFPKEHKSEAKVLKSLEVLNRILALAKDYHLITKLEVQFPGELMDGEQRASNLDVQALLKTNPASFRPWPFKKRALQQLDKSLKKDLTMLTTWSSALLNECWLNSFKPGSPSKLESLLTAFNRIREVISARGEVLYACRMKAEQAWRGDKHYLQSLDQLDKQLGESEAALQGLLRQWIKEVKMTFTGEVFEKACGCLEVLASEEMLKMESLSWAEATCYHLSQ